MRWLVLVVAACGCNSLFGLPPTELTAEAARPDADPRADLDGDGIKDVNDPCIAPETDGLIDTDGDGIPNGADPCPFDKVVGGDADQDGIPDACDPFPSPGDRVRCVMAFTDPDFDVAVWRADSMQPIPWVLYTPRQLAGSQGSLVSDWPFEAPVTTTYDIAITVVLPQVTGEFDVIPRAGGSEANGCELVTSSTQWALGPKMGPGIPSVFLPPSNTYALPLRLAVTFETSALIGDDPTNMRCTLRMPNSIATSRFATMLPAGTLGFTTSVSVRITGIAIYERDDAPRL